MELRWANCSWVVDAQRSWKLQQQHSRDTGEFAKSLLGDAEKILLESLERRAVVLGNT